jgi:hypothetical protein
MKSYNFYGCGVVWQRDPSSMDVDLTNFLGQSWSTVFLELVKHGVDTPSNLYKAILQQI